MKRLSTLFCAFTIVYSINGMGKNDSNTEEKKSIEIWKRTSRYNDLQTNYDNFFTYDGIVTVWINKLKNGKGLLKTYDNAIFSFKTYPYRILKTILKEKTNGDIKEIQLQFIKKKLNNNYSTLENDIKIAMRNLRLLLETLSNSENAPPNSIQQKLLQILYKKINKITKINKGLEKISAGFAFIGLTGMLGYCCYKIKYKKKTPKVSWLKTIFSGMAIQLGLTMGSLITGFYIYARKQIQKTTDGLFIQIINSIYCCAKLPEKEKCLDYKVSLKLKSIKNLREKLKEKTKKIVYSDIIIKTHE